MPDQRCELSKVGPDGRLAKFVRRWRPFLPATERERLVNSEGIVNQRVQRLFV